MQEEHDLLVGDVRGVCQLLRREVLLVLLQVLAFLLGELHLSVEDEALVLQLFFFALREVVVAGLGAVEHRGVRMWVLVWSLNMRNRTLLHQIVEILFDCMINTINISLGAVKRAQPATAAAVGVVAVVRRRFEHLPT